MMVIYSVLRPTNLLSLLVCDVESIRFRIDCRISYLVQEYAACEFIKWLSASEQNMRFVNETGYLPVTKQAFEEEMDTHIQNIEDPRVQMMLNSVIEMYESYTFFFAPTYADFDTDSSNFEDRFFTVLSDDKESFLAGETVSSESALSRLK